MSRHIVLLSLFVVQSLCMQMRETVERTVMVRTTGSDLQPAATGFIYKQENDGEASVIKMGESEVMEHLAKIYEQPKAFAAPIPVAAGPFYASDEDETNAASDNKERVIPVKEEEVDGIAEDDYKKILKEYKAKLDDPHSFDDYLQKLGSLDGFYPKYDNDDDKAYKGYKVNKHYNNGDAGDYHTEKFESYKITGNKKGHDDADTYGKHYKDIHDEKGGYYGYKPNHDGAKGQKTDGFYKYHDSEDKKDIYDKKSNGNDFHKFTNNQYHTSDDGGYKKGAHESDQHDFGKGGEHNDKSGEEGTSHSYEEENSSHDGSSKFGSDSGNYNGKGYGFKIKH